MGMTLAVKETSPNPAVEINDLSFTYPGVECHPPPGSVPLIDGFSLTLHTGNRCLLVGSNGAGKTTILKILGGKHMVEPDMVRVLGRSAFHDTVLTSSGDPCYLGGEKLFSCPSGVPLPVQTLEQEILPLAGYVFGKSGLFSRKSYLGSKLHIVLARPREFSIHHLRYGASKSPYICRQSVRAPPNGFW
ncbi:ABC transporter I family member 20-like [Diospyros lotus]|uniref:ABC transporter I family member 20-like n=1 Tax=Diospyros lotus TaxID=55363 RepID=UPI00225962AB|nr:ABC transporter I family member 20-like [Diospyros lotus]